ncbi:hypothetical protein HDU86_005377 [Geranomyces michiganensis]|nr:hypothetical protein HDU86_005377 [Geranomyces michiganensis]
MWVASSIAILLASTALQAANAACPVMLSRRDSRALPEGHPAVDRLITDHGHAGVKDVNLDSLEADLIKLFTTSQPFWPADFGNYAPFMVRLAWHCNGSYRVSDGRGGCDGGRIRFAPELSWPDNGNLDKALKLLEPVKAKYGDALSWGDLISFTGDTAIKSMGGPILGFCGGRQDDANGDASLFLGPSAEQEAIHRCPVNGECTSPLGPTTLGLIYVNPAGHMGVPDPVGSVPDIRSTFGNMGMDDAETVALIGGGHAFGKTHGACKLGAGKCGSGPNQGIGENAVTSGFEGQWTGEPTKWGNDYFKNLLKYNWTLFDGPAGQPQWKPAATDKIDADDEHVRMLTADVALLHDPSYLKLVQKYATDLKSLEHDFARSWYKLMSRDVGPAHRCKGPRVPPPQPFQNPLPAPPTKLANFATVKADLAKILTTKATIAGDNPSGDYYGALFVELAWRSASTFRITDHFGGANGARIRLSPEKDYADNVGMDKVMEVLNVIKRKYSDGLSWADLIVLAGEVALERAGSRPFKFAGGRVDAADGVNPAPRTYYYNSTVAARDNMQVMGFTPAHYVALGARLRSPSQQARLGLGDKTYTTHVDVLGNEYFKILLQNHWVPTGAVSKTGAKQYKADGYGEPRFVTDADLALIWDPELRPFVEKFAKDEQGFKTVFAEAWDALMNADMAQPPTPKPKGLGLYTTEIF